LETYIENLDSVMLSTEQVSSVLESGSRALIRAEALLTQATSGTLSQSNRDAIAAEIDGLLEQLVSQANGESLGRHLFGGHRVSTPPYAVERTGGKITSVTYQGASGDLLVPVAPGVEYSGLIVGDDVFRSHSRSLPVFLGGTGAAGGAGTSSATGDVYLSVQHDNTTFQAPAQGLTGGDSASSDTIVGVHTLKIVAADKTLQLDNGPVMSFQLGQTDVKVVTAGGDAVYVDVSGWDNLDGNVTVIGEAKLSIDDGVTTTAVTDFSSDAAVTDADGRVLYVDTSGITTGGIEPVRIGGTYDMFATLINVRDLMVNERAFSDDDQTRLLLQSVDSVREVASNIRSNAASVGARLQAMDSLRTSLDNSLFATESEADMLQDVDIVQLSAELARTQTFYQMTLQTASKLLSMSLLDFI